MFVQHFKETSPFIWAAPQMDTFHLSCQMEYYGKAGVRFLEFRRNQLQKKKKIDLLSVGSQFIRAGVETL